MTRLFTFLFLAVLFSLNSVAQVNVTFRVRMTGQTPSPLGIHLAGKFQNWQPDSTVMLNSGADAYFVTVALPTDSTYQFKFVNGNAWGMDEAVPGACATGGNRTVTIGKRDTVLPAYCYGTCNICTPVDSVNVTYRVDMQNQTVSDSGVHIAGDFESWSPGKVLMTNTTGKIYAASFKIPANVTYQFKFINGPSWPDNETVPVGCATTLNRTATIGKNDTILPAFCFGSCTPCPVIPSDSVNVTFRVDMQNQTVSDSGVHVAGKFQGWAPGKSLMTQVGTTSVYAATFKLPVDSTYQFKFINGPSWPDNETVPVGCATTLNRTATIGAKDTTLPAFCFGSCSPCPALPTDSVNVTFRVDMQNQTVSDSGVHVAGKFQGWAPGKSLMTQVGTTSVYSATFKLPVDSTYPFKFINGPSWPDNETVPAGCVTGGNRTATIGTRDTILPPFCFGSCSACPSLPPPGDSINVTFKVDMSNQTVSANGVHLAGSFQNWLPGTTPMSSIGSGVYAATLKITKNTSYQYKFVNGNAWGTDETVPGACAVNLNRAVTTGANDTTLGVPCFGSCIACVPPTVVNITFQVNMGILPISPNGVHIMGNFQGWDPAGTPMVQQGITSVYQVVIPLYSGDSIQYKFVNGNTSPDAETPPSACTIGTTNNRVIVVPANNYIIPLVCYSSCSACAISLGTENINSNNDIQVYPSPAHDYFNISLGANKSYQVNIYDSEGRLVQANVMNKTLNTIPLDNFSSGVYTIRFMNNNEVVVRKLMVTR